MLEFLNSLTKTTFSTLCTLVLDKKYSRTNTLISLAENIRKYLDEINFVCSIF